MPEKEEVLIQGHPDGSYTCGRCQKIYNERTTSFSKQFALNCSKRHDIEDYFAAKPIGFTWFIHDWGRSKKIEKLSETHWQCSYVGYKSAPNHLVHFPLDTVLRTTEAESKKIEKQLLQAYVRSFTNKIQKRKKTIESTKKLMAAEKELLKQSQAELKKFQKLQTKN